MLLSTDIADAPWTIVRSNDNKRARLNAKCHCSHTWKYGFIVRPPDSKTLRRAKAVYEHEEVEAPTGGGRRLE